MVALHWNRKSILASSILLVLHLICWVLYIAGWATSGSLEDHDDNNGRNDAEPSRFYFVWGLLLGIMNAALLVLAGLFPHPLLRRIFLLLLGMFTLMLFFPLTNVMHMSIESTTISDCSDLSGHSKDECTGGKILFVASFMWMWVLAAKLMYTLFFYVHEATTASYLESSFQRV